MKDTKISGPSLADEMRDVEELCPGWHLWLSDAGRIWAVIVCSPFPLGCGCTLDAPTPDAMRHEIAVQEREWARAA